MSTESGVAVTFLDALVDALRKAGTYNRHDQSPPAAVLWPDKSGQWRPLAPLLRERLPLLTLGPYDSSSLTGPAYWIRCAIAGTLPELVLPADTTPVIYLPDVSRQEIRAVEDCPRALQPLAELQYRGVLWTQKSGRDWTVAAFLQNGDDGLGIEIGADDATKDALLRALPALADEPIAGLRRRAPLRATFFNDLLNPDQVRSILLWLNDPKEFRKGRSAQEWEAFRSACREGYEIDPEKHSPIDAALLLGQRQGSWETVWHRFAEAPDSYPGLPDRLRQARAARKPLPLFDRPESWPQENEEREKQLRDRLGKLRGTLPADARIAIAQLEAEHGVRRNWVWASLGKAPLATALQHLARMAQATAQPVAGATVDQVASDYTDHGWHADDAVLQALAAVEHHDDLDAVKAAIGALYRPWLEAGAKALQQASRFGPDGDAYAASPPTSLQAGECLLFCDGLRYDVARQLAIRLEDDGVTCEVSWRLAALPTVTGTAKPAVSPVAGSLRGGTDLGTVAVPAKTRVTIDVLRNLLQAAGVQVLQGDEVGDPTGRAWAEAGQIDSYGHGFGVQIAHHVDAELRLIDQRIRVLLAAGWQRVIAVTDHGWLLVPEGMPKVELSEHLTELRKGRCARLKPGAQTTYQVVPWHWDPDVAIAVAPGISCFEAGKEYEHGGISPQECIVPVLTVALAPDQRQHVEIVRVGWRGLRCQVQIAGADAAMRVDLRAQPGNPDSSMARLPVPVGPEGVATLLVPDDDLEGGLAAVVVLDATGAIIAQHATIVGK